MSVSISPYPRFKAFYPASGNPLSGGQLYTASPGTTVQYGLPPSYPMTTYTDSTGSTPNTNPVILDGNGEADVWLSTYTKLVLFDQNGNLVWSKDNVSSQAAIQASALQWVPQSAPTYVNPTQFSVAGNQTGTFLPGTAVQATIVGGPILGIIQSASAGGTPVITTVTVAWFSTALNASLTAIALGIVAGGVPGSLPIMPTQPLTSNMTANASNLCQTYVANSANGVSFTLPSANTVPPGSYYDLINAGTGDLTIVGTVNGNAAGQTLTPLTGERLISDGTNWWSTPGMGPTFSVVPVANAANLSISNLYHQFTANAANFNLPAANAVPSGGFYDIFNTGASNATVTPTSGTINGAANLVLAQYTGKRVFSDGANWWAK